MRQVVYWVRCKIGNLLRLAGCALIHGRDRTLCQSGDHRQMAEQPRTIHVTVHPGSEVDVAAELRRMWMGERVQ